MINLDEIFVPRDSLGVQLSRGDIVLVQYNGLNEISKFNGRYVIEEGEIFVFTDPVFFEYKQYFEPTKVKIFIEKFKKDFRFN